MSKTNKITHNYKCDKCDKTATINIQNANVEFEIWPDGAFKETDTWGHGDDYNDFYCDEHYNELRKDN